MITGIQNPAYIQPGIPSGFTAGSIPYIGASGIWGQNNTNFFWDVANARLGIGTTTPTGKLEIKGGNNNSLYINNDGSQYTSAYFANNGTVRAGLQLDNTSNLFRFLTVGTTTSLVLGTQGASSLTIDPSGNYQLLNTTSVPGGTFSGYSILFAAGGDLYCRNGAGTQSKLNLGAPTASTTNTVTNKIATNIDGVTYYLLASTSST